MHERVARCHAYGIRRRDFDDMIAYVNLSQAHSTQGDRRYTYAKLIKLAALVLPPAGTWLAGSRRGSSIARALRGNDTGWDSRDPTPPALLTHTNPSSQAARLPSRLILPACCQPLEKPGPARPASSWTRLQLTPTGKNSARYSCAYVPLPLHPCILLPWIGRSQPNNFIHAVDQLAKKLNS